MAGKVYDLNDLPTDLEGIENMLADVNAEIADITDQLAEFDDEDEWAARAMAARRYRYTVRAKLEVRLRKLTSPKHDPLADEGKIAYAREIAKASQAKAAAKREAQERQAQMQREAAEAKAARVAASNARENARFMVLKAWLKTSHPDVWQEAVSVLDAVGE